MKKTEANIASVGMTNRVLASRLSSVCFGSGVAVVILGVFIVMIITSPMSVRFFLMFIVLLAAAFAAVTYRMCVVAVDWLTVSIMITECFSLIHRASTCSVVTDILSSSV